MKEQGLHYFVKLVNDWKHQYHTDIKGNVIFQNAETLTNVVFTHNSMHKIQDHSRGIDDLPKTIMTPDEIWARWEDVTTQQIVLRNYINGNYVVQTRNGIVADAFLTGQLAKYRVGALLLL